MVSAVSKAIKEAGSLENIRVWCFPTPQQRLIFSSSKLVLLGPWGCGKTLFLTAEAIKKNGIEEKAMILIFAQGKFHTVNTTITKPSFRKRRVRNGLPRTLRTNPTAKGPLRAGQWATVTACTREPNRDPSEARIASPGASAQKCGNCTRLRGRDPRFTNIRVR